MTRRARPTSILLAAVFLIAGAAAYGLQDDAAPTAPAARSPGDVLAEVEKLLQQADQSASAQRPPRPVEMWRRGAPEPLTAEHIEQIIAVARDVDPELARRLSEFRAEHPGPRFERSLRQARHLVGLRDLKLRDPRLYDMKIAQLRLEPLVEAAAAELRKARTAAGSASPDTRLENELRKLLKQQIGLSVATRAQYLVLLEQQVKTLRDEIARDSAGLSDAVERKMAQLLEEPQ